MKKILALALFAVALVSCRQTMQTDGFKLSGHLEGLQVGDTLFLKTFLLPDWKEDGTDTILVEKEGTFSAFIPMEHTTFYLLMHQPKMGEPLRSCIRGAEIIARVGDDIKLKGSLDYLGAVRHSGGFYDNSLVARYDSLTASSNTEMIDIFSQILKYQDTKQNDSVAKYGQMYNEYHRPLILKTVRDSLALKVNDMEYAAFMYVRRRPGRHPGPRQRMPPRTNGAATRSSKGGMPTLKGWSSATNTGSSPPGRRPTTNRPSSTPSRRRTWSAGRNTRGSSPRTRSAGSGGRCGPPRRFMPTGSITSSSAATTSRTTTRRAASA